MANQQIKFYAVTEEKYKTIDPKNNGGLYFITDNGEIRKGGQHITGTRVFTATDTTTTGITSVDQLDIKYGTTSIKTEYTLTADDVAEGGAYAGQTEGAKVTIPTAGVEQPKRGDMLVVSRTLVTGKTAKSAYIYGSSDWEACDGDVDASKVILTHDITLAGNYTNVGNLNKGDKVIAGTTFNDVLEKILVKKLDDAIVTNPSFSLSGSNDSVEVGSTYGSQTYTATWSDGAYTYDAYVSDGVTQKATGAKVGDWTITAYNGKTQKDATISGNTAKITTDSITVAEAKEYTLATFTVTNDLSEVKYAATNLKTQTEANKIITQTTNTAQSRSVTGFRYLFWGTLPFASKINVLDKEFDVSTVLTSATVREGSTFHWNKGTSFPNSSTAIEWTEKSELVFLAPDTTTNRTKKITKAYSKSSNYSSNQVKETLSYLKNTDGTPKTVTIKGAGSDAGVPYLIWVIDLGADQTEGLKVTWA